MAGVRPPNFHRTSVIESQNWNPYLSAHLNLDCDSEAAILEPVNPNYLAERR